MSTSKLLVANRGEIAVRIFRTAHELSMTTVAIYAEEDENSGHRQKADASVVLGHSGEFGPIEAYLQADRIVEIAKRMGVGLVHPGYGFLSENADFAAKVRDAGMIFVGPSADVIRQMGDKVLARQIAQACKVPTVPGLSSPIKDVKEVHEFIKRFGYPVIVKASFGGGGRGMRVLREGDSVEDTVAAAQSEALAAFGNGAVFIEKYLSRPKHIEVQVLSDSHGNHVHLFERDCSLQRKHQKILEMSPAHGVSQDVREGMFKAALDIASHVRYENAGTVEFLVEDDKFYFIEMNPRIQVEHTVTEELLGIDIVSAQLRIAQGQSLEQLGLSQGSVEPRGCAIQCRITTEIPSEGFRPDTGPLEVCRLPTGNGVRLDYSSCFPGADISPFYDPLLVKCTVLGSDLDAAQRKALRALTECRIRGVQTNISLLVRILEHPFLAAGKCWTTFIDDVPELVSPSYSRNRAQKFIRFLGDAAVNGSQVQGQMKAPGLDRDIVIGDLLEEKTGVKLDTAQPCTTGWRNTLLKHGPQEFCRLIRSHQKTLITDTTWRDGQQSLLATRVRTRDLAAIAPLTSHAFASAYSLECWGGATFDVALRFLFEDPWERLRRLRKLVPYENNIPFQMLLRSTNGVAYSALPDNALYHFVKLAKDTGIDIFRVFDSLNDLGNLEVGIRAALEAGGLVEGAIMYTGDMLKAGKYDLAYYLNIVDKIVELGCHVIAIKSMSGVMKPAAGRILVKAIREKYQDIPIHVHTHDTNGTGVATMVACVEAGADIVDTAIDSLSGSTSQPAAGAMVAALEGSGFDSDISLHQVEAVDAYWAQLRLMYAGFDADLRSPDPTIYSHEIPGGQYSNLLFQARQLGLGSQWAETREAYVAANHLLGDIVKATPTSKAVGDLAQFMVSQKLSAEQIVQDAGSIDFPGSVLDYFEGLMGQPFDGFPEPLRTNALRGRRQKICQRPGLTLQPVDFEEVRRQIANMFPSRQPTEDDVASFIMYPEVYADFRHSREEFGDLTELATPVFLTAPKAGQQIRLQLEDDKILVVQLIAIGPVAEDSGKREVIFRVNGELRTVHIQDKSSLPKSRLPKANPRVPGEIGAPMSGKIVRIVVKDKTEVKQGSVLLSISAMKMEIDISAPIDGCVEVIAVKGGDLVEKDDLVLTMTPL